MFWKKKIKDNSQRKIILGMVILQDENSFNLERFHEDFTSNYKETISKATGDSSSFVFDIDGEFIVVAHMPIPIPNGDIEGTAKYAYNWETAVNDLRNHKSHLIVSVTSGGQDPIKRFKIFTHVVCSLLRITNSPGVYQGTQSLLIPKNDYVSEASLMTEKYLPLNLWIYFGFRVTDKGCSGYTYGLKEFDKKEIEIINSSKSLEEINEFLFNMAHYVLAYDVTFKNGQTCGMSENERFGVTESKGVLVEGKTIKLEY